MSTEQLQPTSLRKPGGIAELMAIALPMVVSLSCETLMMFTDRLFLARLGPEQMTAAMGGGMTCFVFMTFFLGLIGFTTAFVAQHYGAGQLKRCPLVIGQGVILAIAAYPLVLACIPLGHGMFRLMDIPAAQLPYQRAYFNIVMFGAVLGLLRCAVGGFFSGLGRTKVIMISAFVALAVNVVMNYLLIFGKMGFPAMGIRGAAIGTVVGSLAGTIVLIACYLTREMRREFNVLAGLRFDGPLMRRLLRFGSPAGLEFFLNMMAFNLVVMNFQSYGVAEGAAITIALNWDMVSFIPMIGVNVGVTSLVGRYMGARNPDTAHRVTMSGLKLVACYGAITLTLFSLFPRPLVEVFRPDNPGETFARTVELGAFMLRLVSIYVIADALALVFSGALRGAGDTFWTMCLSVSGHWVVALISIALVRVVHADPKVAWAAFVCFVLFLSLAFFLRYRSGKWRSIKVVEEDVSAERGNGK